MSLSDDLLRLLFGAAGRTGLSLWSLFVAVAVFYLSTVYIRKRREYLVCHQKVEIKYEIKYML